MTVVTRFAPSPTGDLHIGGARTALFNKLYARAMGGEYLVRIEDTDKVRNTTEALNGIHDALKWLGLLGDRATVYQSQNADRHVEIAHELVLRGAAYYDFTTPAEMDALRTEWQEKNPKTPFRYLDNPWRLEPTAAGFMPEGPPVVRLKAPRNGMTTIHDLVQGTVTVQNNTLDDMILLRSDRTPTYMLASVVDDHDMGVTHVIRGDDHLNNAFRQIPIYDGMGWDRPVYAHVPLIFSEAGKKLSKRTGAAGVFEYQDMGIQPEALLNYLAKLGWGHGDDEFFTMHEAATWFDIKDVGKAPARLDSKKLKNISAHYIKNSDPYDLTNSIISMLEVEFPLSSKGHVYSVQIQNLVPALATRSWNLKELYSVASFVWAARPLVIDEIAARNLDIGILGQMHKRFTIVEWKKEILELVVEEAINTLGMNMRDLSAALRAALTGSTTSPPIYDVLIALGRDETLGRLEDCL